MGRVVLVTGGALTLVLAVLCLRWPAAQRCSASVESRAAPPPQEPPVVLEAPADVGPERAPEGAREPAPAGGRSAALVRGQVIDALTGRPVPDGLGLGVVFSAAGTRGSAWVRLLREHGARLGPGGSFEVTSSRPEELVARVAVWSNGGSFDEGEHRYRDERQADGSWRLAVEVGYCARLELVAPPGVALTPLTATLIEIVGGEEHDWPRDTLERRQPLFASWAEAAFPEDPSHRRLLEVTAFDEDADTWDGRVEVPVRNGFQPEPVTVVLQPPTSASGRVLDEHGAPWSGAVVELLRRFDEVAGVDADDLWEETDEDGAFEFSVLAPGEYRVRVCAAFTPGSPESVVIRPGENELGTLVLERGARGSVTGALVAQADDLLRGDPFALVSLLDPESGLEFVDLTGFELFQDPDGRSVFEFSDVPEGEYELHVLPMDARRYPLAPVAVRAPAADIEIAALTGRFPSYELALFDARSAAALEPEVLLCLRQGRWLPLDLAAGDVLEGYGGEPLVAGASGHRPLCVEPAAEAEGRRRLELALEPGFGRAVLVRDLSASSIPVADDFAAWCGPPLAGVLVLADGREVARSDGTGLALVGLERAPASLTFERAGYRTVSSRVDGGVQLVLMARE